MLGRLFVEIEPKFIAAELRKRRRHKYVLSLLAAEPVKIFVRSAVINTAHTVKYKINIRLKRCRVFLEILAHDQHDCNGSSVIHCTFSSRSGEIITSAVCGFTTRVHIVVMCADHNPLTFRIVLCRGFYGINYVL